MQPSDAQGVKMMQSKWVFFLVFIVGLSIAGCSMLTTQVQTVSVRTYPVVEETLHDLVVQTLQDDGEIVREKKNRVMTEWVVRRVKGRQWHKLPSSRYRYQIQVIAVNEGESRVEVQIDRERYEGDGSWAPDHPRDKRAKGFFRKLEKRGSVKPLSEY
jgi:hypothetical protein